MAGTPIGGTVAWGSIVDGIREENYQGLNELAGRFALAILDKRFSALYLVTDRIGQYPLYVLQNGAISSFSTSQASFCRLPRWSRNQRTMDS